MDAGHAVSGSFDVAEMQREGQLLLIGQTLVAKDQHAAIVHALFDSGDLGRRQRFGAIDAGNYTGEARRQGLNRNWHFMLPSQARMMAQGVPRC